MFAVIVVVFWLHVSNSSVILSGIMVVLHLKIVLFIKKEEEEVFSILLYREREKYSLKLSKIWGDSNNNIYKKKNLKKNCFSS